MDVPLLTTRRAAIDANEVRFDTGKPCKRGHLSPRYTCNGGCVMCLKPVILRAEEPRRNQMRLTALATLSHGEWTPEKLEYFNQKLFMSCEQWERDYAFDSAAATAMGMPFEHYRKRYTHAGPATAQFTIDDLKPTELAGTVPLASYVAAGWTPAQLMTHGYATVRDS